MWLSACTLVLLPVVNVDAQFVMPSAAQWPPRLESPIPAPPLPWRPSETSGAVVELNRRDQSVVSVVLASDDHGPSYASYALWGIGIGGGLGLATGAFADRDGACHDCMFNGKLMGTVGGALLGWTIGSIAYFGSQSPSTAAQ